jgi:hypothetical protein
VRLPLDCLPISAVCFISRCPYPIRNRRRLDGDTAYGPEIGNPATVASCVALFLHSLHLAAPSQSVD